MLLFTIIDSMRFWIISLFLVYAECQFSTPTTYSLHNERLKRQLDPSLILGTAVDVGLTAMETINKGAAIRLSSKTNAGMYNFFS